MASERVQFATRIDKGTSKMVVYRFGEEGKRKKWGGFGPTTWLISSFGPFSD